MAVPGRLIAHGAIIWDQEEGEALLKCSVCYEYLPLDPEFWEIPSGFQRCKECRKTNKRDAVDRLRRRRGIKTNPSGQGKRMASRRYYAENAERLRKESLERYHQRKREQNEDR